MSEFFYRSGLNEYGPLTSTEIRKLADAGRLSTDVEVRKGRSGKWISAANVPGLFRPPVPHNELAINEMDIVTSAAAEPLRDSAAAEQSECDTAVDTQAQNGQPAATRATATAAVAGQKGVDRREELLVQCATAVAGACYFASLFGAVLGIVHLFGDQTLLHHVFIGICFLFALIGLASGCGISLLLANRRR